MKLTKEEQKELLAIARTAIQEVLERKTPNITKPSNKKISEKLGVFVTLTINGELRGCIGNILPVYPLYEGIMKNAVHAAFRDYRFTPLMADELNKIKIEISILTIPKLVKYNGPEELLKSLSKKPGVILNYNGFSSVFLPQVWEELTKPEEFMKHLSMKAGLPPDTWKDKKTKIEFFEVESIEE